MFDVRLMVEDKKLPRVLWALDGLVVGAPNVIPVRAAKAKGGKVMSTLAGPVSQAVAESIYAAEVDVVKTDFIKRLVVEAGGSAGSVNNIIAKLRKAKILGKAARGKGYPILKAKE